jgi:ABC-2 type transport system ATP-binding protein
MSDIMIQATGLRKTYGKLQALQDMHMTVYKGDIYGFVGPNGAGKSTTIKILATLLRPDAGTALIGGVPVTKGDTVRGLIGYMPDTFGVYEDMTVWQYLEFFAAAYFIPTRQRRPLLEDILKLTDLDFKRDAMVQSLSRGMQQRLGVARVLVHDPQVLLLDEPASGLDPRARIELRELLKELSRMGKTVLISSHILSELEEMCTRLGIVEQGRTVFEGTVAEMRARLAGHGSIVIEVVPEQTAQIAEALRQAPFAGEVTVAEALLTLKLANGTPPEEVAAWLFQQGARLRRFQPEEVSLESAFMTLTEGKLA